MVGWHHRLNGHGFGWTPGVGDGQGGLACCSSWGRKESDTTEQPNCCFMMFHCHFTIENLRLNVLLDLSIIQERIFLL